MQLIHKMLSSLMATGNHLGLDRAPPVQLHVSVIMCASVIPIIAFLLCIAINSPAVLLQRYTGMPFRLKTCSAGE